MSSSTDPKTPSQKGNIQAITDATSTSLRRSKRIAQNLEMMICANQVAAMHISEIASYEPKREAIVTSKTTEVGTDMSTGLPGSGAMPTPVSARSGLAVGRRDGYTQTLVSQPLFPSISSGLFRGSGHQAATYSDGNTKKWTSEPLFPTGSGLGGGSGKAVCLDKYTQTSVSQPLTESVTGVKTAMARRRRPCPYSIFNYRTSVNTPPQPQRRSSRLKQF